MIKGRVKEKKIEKRAKITFTQIYFYYTNGGIKEMKIQVETEPEATNLLISIVNTLVI